MISIYKISYKNLLRKKARTSLTIIGIALSSFVLVSLLGFNLGYEKSLGKDIENMGFQYVLTAKGCPYEAATLMLTGSAGLKYIDELLADSVSKNKDVEATTPMLMHAELDPNIGDHGAMALFIGVDPKTFPPMKSYLKFLQGDWFSENDALEVVLGFETAELEQREVGDEILVPNKDITLKVVGILERSGTQDDGTIFIPLRTAQIIFNKESKLTGLGIRINPDSDALAFEEKLYEIPDVQVVSMAQVRNTIMSLVASARAIVLSIAVIAVIIAMFGVVNTILMSVFERYEEIGILKSMGAMPIDIFKMIWSETAILCSIGGFVGVLMSITLSKATEVLVRNFLPYSPHGDLIEINFEIAFLSFLIITISGILSGFYPAFRASRVRPLDAIRSEML